MAEPRVIGPDDAGPEAPAHASEPADFNPNGHTNGHDGNGHSNGNGAATTEDVVRVLRPEVEAGPPPPAVPAPGPTQPIAWLAPADPSFVVLRDDLRDDLYDDLLDDLADDLRQDLRIDVRADLDADLVTLRDDLYDEIDDLRDDVFLDGDDGPATVLPVTHFQTDSEIERDRSRRVAFVAASVLAVAMIAAIVLLWQRADTAAIVAARPEPAVVAPPDLDGVLTHVEQLDQQLAGLLAVSASPATPNDVSLQIEALRTELAGVQGCLLAVRRAVDAGVDTASAVEYC